MKRLPDTNQIFKIFFTIWTQGYGNCTGGNAKFIRDYCYQRNGKLFRYSGSFGGQKHIFLFFLMNKSIIK